MMIFKLALSNIKRNYTKYGMFFLSLVFCIFSSYIFMAFKDNETIFMLYSNDFRYRTLFDAFFIMIIASVTVFLYSSNNRFIRARKKEVSTYVLFGMSNGKVVLMLLIEMLVIGSMAIVVSLFLGVLFAKFLAMVLVNITLVEQLPNGISFPISIYPILKTIVIYYVLFVALSIGSWFSINSFQLIDLFKADKIGQKTNKKVAYLQLIGGSILVVIGYRLACIEDMMFIFSHMVHILCSVILGTYFVFSGCIPILIGFLKRFDKYKYDGMRNIVISTLSHRVKNISVTMASIAILSAVATTAVASTFTLYYNSKISSYRMQGQDIYYVKTDERDKRVEEVINSNNSEIVNKYDVHTYLADLDILCKGEYFTMESGRYKIYSEQMLEDIIGASRHMNIEIDITERDQAIFLCSGYFFKKSKERFMDLPFSIGDEDFVVNKAVNGRGLAFGAHEIMVISDEAFRTLMDKELIRTRDEDGSLYPIIRALKVKDPLTNIAMIEGIKKLFDDPYQYALVYNKYRDSLINFGIICFIGIFMGVLFILMTASHLYFEQIMLANEEKHYYVMLRKIGLEERVEKKIIGKKLWYIFFVPLFVGILHSIFAMKSADTVIFNQVIIGENTYGMVLKTSAVMYVVCVLVYLGFYSITKQQYNKVVNS